MASLMILSSLLGGHSALAQTRGIYLSQQVAMKPARLRKFILAAKKTHLTSFIVDVKYRSKRYPAVGNTLHHYHLSNVARIVVFPNGKKKHVLSRSYWERRMQLINYAIANGADAIQLDYIRYSSKNNFNFHKNIRDITRVVAFFHHHIHGRVPLEIDVFGVAAHEPQRVIGQDVRALAPYVDAICPMVYPSHYQGMRSHPSRAFDTIYTSLMALKKQLKDYPKVKIIAYIELNNYRHPMTFHRKMDYIRDEIRAVNKADVAGWYVWSPQHYYSALFQVHNS